MNASPTISVVIPCYNGAQFIRETLDSVVAQTLPALEVLVVDDGSTDDSAAIAASFGPPVRVIRQPNQGESVARNRGIAEAQGEWVAFLDADDLWRPEKLDVQAKLMVPDVGAVCSGNACIREGSSGQPAPGFVPRPDAFLRSWVLEHGAPCHISSLVVRRANPVRFPTWTSFAEDLVYYLDLLEATKVAIAPRQLTIYRLHPGGQTARPEMGERREAALNEWFKATQDRLPERERTALGRALKRREKYSLISRALGRRRTGRPASGLVLYARVLILSLFTPTSPAIVLTGLRGCLAAAAEALRIRKHPVRLRAQPRATPFTPVIEG